MVPHSLSRPRSLPHTLHLLVLLLALTLGACATAAGTAGSDAERAAPRLIPAGAPPEIVITRSGSAGRDALRLVIEVEVDAAGSPEMNTLRVSGPGSVENRAAIERWIRGSRFEPATRGGEPVAGVYRTQLRARVRVSPR